MLTRTALRELAAYRGEPAVTSFYLDVNGSPPRLSAVEARVEHLFRIARHVAAGGGPEAGRALEGDLGRIATWLRTPRNGGRERGLAAFVCEAEGFFATVSLDVQVRDAISVDERPHVGQLVAALDEPLLVVLVDRERARLVRCEAGQVTESPGPTDEVAREIDADVELGSFERREEEASRGHLRRVAAMLGIANGPQAERVLLAGPAAAQLARYLPAEVTGRLAGRLGLTMAAERHEIVAAARGALVERQAARHAALVSELANSPRAAAGLSSTLDALAGHRVATLLVSLEGAISGVRCEQCGYLAPEGTVSCARCGGVTAPVADLTEAAISDALEDGAEVEVLGLGKLAAAGGIGALERY